jgi:hypothetical protein
MARILLLYLVLLVAGCGGEVKEAALSKAMSPQSQAVALSPHDATVSSTRRVVAGMYIDTDATGTAAQVYRLYRAAFGRVADPGGLGFYVGQIEVLRQALPQVAADFVASQEFKTTYGSLDNTQFVTLLYSNVLHRSPDSSGLSFWTAQLAAGTARADVLVGFSESNENKAQTASDISAGITFVPWPNGRVYLADGNYYETDPSGNAAQVYRLYQAAFGRAADPGGLGFYVGNIDSAGLSLTSVAQSFIASAEFTQKYGSLSDSDFVTQLYANVLHRAPDSSGLAFWTSVLAGGTSRATVLVGFSESTENKSNTLDAVFAGMEFQPWPSAPSMPAVAKPTGITGTAATGGALAGTSVALKDSANASSSATTQSDGRFRIDTTGLAPPFLLRATTTASTLYSVSVANSNTGTINVTPITDTVVRTWYQLKNQSADSAFASPTVMPAPTPDQAQSILQTLAPVMQLAAQASGVTLATPQDLVSQAFVADGTGMDLLLDNTKIASRSGGFDLTITAGSATQTTSWNLDPGTGTITAASSTTSPAGDTSTSIVTGVVAGQSAQATALASIESLLTSLSNTITSKNGAVTAADLTPFWDPNMVNDGQGRASFIAQTVSDLSGVQTVTFSIQRMVSLDTDAGTASAVLLLSLSGNGQTATESDTFYFKQVNGSWLVTGNGYIARIGVQAEARTNQGINTAGNGPDVNIDVRPPKGTVSAASATSTFTIPAMQRSATEVLDDGSQLDVFVTNTGAMSGPLPAAGTPVTITLTTASGNVQYAIPINAWTTEQIRITSPGTTSIPAGPLSLSWTRPATYAVQTVKLGLIAFTGSSSDPNAFQCISDAQVAATASTAQIDVPATCNGLPVKTVSVNLATEGPNGERSFALYEANLSP